jgi:predicted nuclease of predicted toxin-antitoxin system
MKLLFDQNLSDRLVAALAVLYPDSQHVRTLGMSAADDDEIWRYARDSLLMIVSKDSDFYHRSMLLGHPPKVVWIRLGNCTTAQIIGLLQARQADIFAFYEDDAASFLVLS